MFNWDNCVFRKIENSGNVAGMVYSRENSNEFSESDEHCLSPFLGWFAVHDDRRTRLLHLRETGCTVHRLGKLQATSKTPPLLSFSTYILQFQFSKFVIYLTVGKRLKILIEKMVAKGSHIDFMFLGPPLPGRWIRYCWYCHQNVI